jgi:hypothetical protein
MSEYVEQPIKTWSRLLHKHHLLESYACKDIKNFIRHFLYLTASRRNLIQTERTIRTTIVVLTGWKPKSITNALGYLEKCGEIQRINDHTIRLNPMLANRYRDGWFKNEYTGLQPIYSAEQDALYKNIEKILPAQRSDKKVYDEFKDIRDIRNESEHNAQKVEILEQTVIDLTRTIEELNDELKKGDTHAPETSNRKEAET